MKTSVRSILVLLAVAAGMFLLSWTRGQADEVKTPVKLFNGKDLANFYTFLGSPGKGEKAYGKNNDPEKVFSVVDGAIRVSGKVFGCFATEKDYQNYHLVVEYKWGEETWAPRVSGARDSGILLHAVGADGAASGVWMESIECQLIEGGTGDFILVSGKGKPRMTAEVEYRPTPPGGKRKEPYYKPGGEVKEFTGGRINWLERDPEFKDVKGFRGAKDVEKKHGEWNKLECICAGDTITVILNGQTINRGTKASHTQGKIQFQSEGAEIFFRRIDLLPLDAKK